MYSNILRCSSGGFRNSTHCKKLIRKSTSVSSAQYVVMMYQGTLGNGQRRSSSTAGGSQAIKPGRLFLKFAVDTAFLNCYVEAMMQLAIVTNIKHAVTT